MNYLEKWKKTKYNLSVSNLGRVKSNGRILKGEVINGYKRHHISRNGKSIKLFEHRLVAEAYIPNPDNFPIVNHIDGDKLNNSVGNLEWCSYSYNLEHAYDNNLRSAKGTKNNNSKLTELDVINIRKEYVKEGYPNSRDLSIKYNVSPKCILNIVNYKTWSHVE